MSYIVDQFGCHIAQGRKDRDGYAFHGKTRAHIVAWVAVNGLVPDGKVLDHRCRRRACQNPDHLEPVDQGINEQRKLWRARAKWKTCLRGHDLALNRVLTPEGGITCRACTRGAQNGQG